MWAISGLKTTLGAGAIRMTALFLRIIAAAAALVGLSACETEYAVPEVRGQAPIAAVPVVARSETDALLAFRRVVARVEPVAEATCRQENPRAGAGYCAFTIAVDQRAGQPPNAFQSLDAAGRPVITFTLPLLQQAQSDDEIAFILGHEAGHQIANHIGKSTATATLGGLVLGGLVAASGGTQQSITDAANIGGAVGSRAYSQDFELEADVLGAYIADRAGYDPRRGAQSFARFGGGGGFLATHPPSGRRLATVMAVADSIAAQRAQGITPTIPRN